MHDEHPETGDGKAELDPDLGCREPVDLGAAVSLQTDPAAKVALIGSDVRWYWTSLRTATGELGPVAFRKLTCAAGRARLAPDGSAVLCSAPTGASLVIQLPTGKTLATVPSALEQTALILAPPAASPSSPAPSGSAAALHSRRSMPGTEPSFHRSHTAASACRACSVGRHCMWS